MIALAPFLLVLLAGLALLGIGSWALARALGSHRRGRIVSIDLPEMPGKTLRSERWGFAGRPDELRRLSDGRLVPVEFKSRVSPRRAPLPSHRAQVLAYCFLVEDVTGRAPPYGLLRYSDGREYEVEYGPMERAEVVELLRQVRAPYDGRATPSPGKCRACPWVDVCDAPAI